MLDTDPPPYEIVIVVDGDRNHDNRWLLVEKLGLRVLRIPETRGPAYARNSGAKKATGDILFFVDSDVLTPPDTFSRIAEIFENDMELTAIIGSYDDRPSAPNFLSQYKNLFHHYTHQTGNENASTFWGACGAIRRDAFLAIGGFDESYTQPSIEDIELGYRLKRNGHRIRLCKTLQVKHLKRWGIISLLRTDFFQRALPWAKLLLREGHLRNDLNTNKKSRICVVSIYGLLAASVAYVFRPEALAGVAIFGVLLILLNLPLYRFFVDKRGWLFTLSIIPWHWLYFLYSGLAFAIGYINYRLQNKSSDDYSAS